MAFLQASTAVVYLLSVLFLKEKVLLLLLPIAVRCRAATATVG